jgi:hypothetical protein
MIDTIQAKRTVTKRHLLQILGHLNFAMQVIRPGRAFVGYLLRLAHSVSELHYHVTITSECRLDFRMWFSFLQHWNGKSFFLEDAIRAHDFQLFTDAAASIGHGAYFQGLWFAERWPADFLDVASADMSIALLELYPIVMAAVIWGHLWSTKTIHFACDNTTTVAILNKTRSKSSFIMSLLRKLVLTAATHNFLFFASHVPGRTNLIGDALSRFQMDKFRRLAPQASPTPTRCLPVSQLTVPPATT